MKRFHVAPYAASELDINHEVLECGDIYGRLVSQWDGTHVVAFDKDHAKELASIAIEWANGIDSAIDAGLMDKQYDRHVAIGLWNLGERLNKWAWS